MDPSHAKRYGNFEIENIVSKILSEAYPTGIRIPIDVDRLVERNELVDHIIPAPSLEERYNVAAVLNRKSNGHFDILVEENTFTYQGCRANFSIAHEFGHIILHGEVCSNCKGTEDVIALNKRIQKAYRYIERNANYFAGALLIPLRTIHEHTAELYEGFTKLYGCNVDLIPAKLCSSLAGAYKVSIQAMEIRLNQLKLDKKVLSALRAESPYLDP